MRYNTRGVDEDRGLFRRVNQKQQALETELRTVSEDILDLTSFLIERDYEYDVMHPIGCPDPSIEPYRISEAISAEVLNGNARYIRIYIYICVYGH